MERAQVGVAQYTSTGESKRLKFFAETEPTASFDFCPCVNGCSSIPMSRSTVFTWFGLDGAGYFQSLVVGFSIHFPSA